MAKSPLLTTVRLAFLIVALFNFGCVSHSRADSLLSNPGFELDPAGENHTILQWQIYGPNVFSESNAVVAHSGNSYLKVYQSFSGTVNVNGIYQDYISGPGAIYSADGWAYSPTSDALIGQNVAWIEVSFRDAAGNILALYRSASINTNTLANGSLPKGQWNNLAVTNQYDPSNSQLTNTVTQLVAPPGTYFLRYQILLQGDAGFSNGSVYFDDLNLVKLSSAPYGNMNIVWNDEFEGAAIKNNIWTYDLGNGGWGNNELEYYTNLTSNAFVTNGLLHIVARKQSFGGSSYSSARMKSQGLYNFTYGRVEWRAQFPSGLGFWPALWLLGSNITDIGWPGCGEVDVFENTGTNTTTVQSSIHSGSDATGYYYFINDGVTNFHTYTFDWTTNAMLFYVDGHLFESQTNWGSSFGKYPVPFNRSFFLLMNFAIGGNYVQNPPMSEINAHSIFPAEILVDYVRVYNTTAPFRLAIEQTGSNLLLKWPSNIVAHLQAQTNSAAVGIGSNWVPVAVTTNPVPITPGTGNTFFRLTTP